MKNVITNCHIPHKCGHGTYHTKDGEPFKSHKDRPLDGRNVTYSDCLVFAIAYKQFTHKRQP